MRGAMNHLGITVRDLKRSETAFYAPGLHQFALWADGRDDVDRLHRVPDDNGIAVLDAPADHPGYAPEYCAVFFADADGLKFEFVHMKLA